MPANNESISGRATGVLFFIGFGSLWLCTGLAALNQLNLWTGLLAAAICAALAIPAILLLLRPEAKQPITEDRQRVGRIFAIVNTVQWLGIVLGLILLNIFHRTEYIVPIIAILVGLHLIQLARLFNYVPHYVTGTVLVVWSVAVIAFFPRENIGSRGALGTAAILLISAAGTLRRTWRRATYLA